MQDDINISIVVACLNEQDNIGPCLESLASIDFPHEKMEIIISDGGSTDRTQEIVTQYQLKHPCIRLVQAKKKWTSSVRNAGVEAAKYDYIAFVDADCEVPEGWLKILSNNLLKYQSENEMVVAVGGANILPANSEGFLKAIGIILDSYLGSLGSVQGIVLKEPTLVKSVSTVNALYIKRILLEIGGFDESLLDQGEDADLNFRLHRKGYQFMFIPDSFVCHKMRSTPGKWLKNMFRYGKARARLLKRYPEMRTLSFVLPLVFQASFVFLPAAFLSKWFLWPLLYFPLLLIYSLSQSVMKGAVSSIFMVYLAYFLTHLGYASGEWYGLLSSKVK